MRTTLNAVNERLIKFGMKLVRGRGYFYFVSLPGDNDHPINWGVEQGVYGGVTRLSDKTVFGWVEAARDKIQDAFAYHNLGTFTALEWYAARGL